ncbi:MAG: Zn-dependent protease [Thermoplasmata archaeon]|nr:Zn-dependent protease [Thermoplasmata archaeon]
MYPEGLVFALLIGALLGFVFAAPGAVTIQGGARRFEIGRIAAAGPIANIVVAFISLVGYLSLGLDSNLGKILGFLCFINIFLAIFNLLPFDPLDGKKVIVWNAFAWGILMAIAIVIFFFYLNRMFILGIS